MNFSRMLSWQARTPRERRILLMGLVVGLVFVATTMLPVLGDMYQQRAIVIDELRMEVEREQRLAEDEDTWRQRRQEIDERREELAALVFRDATVPLLSANIQRLVRDHARVAGVSVTSTRLAESLNADGWLLVEQSLSFTLGDQSNLPQFIALLDQSQPWLGISSLSVRHNRNMYTGDITVVGFARTPTLQQVANP